MSRKIEVQKGPIVSDMPTYRTMTHAERVREAYEQDRLRKHGQRTELHEPKQSRK